MSRLPLTNIILWHGEFLDLNVNWTFGDLNHLHVAWKTGTSIFKGGITPTQLPLPNPISAICVLQHRGDRKLYIMLGRSTYRINSKSPKKDKAEGQNNPLHTHAHTCAHSIFRWFTSHTIEGEICFLPPLLSIDNLRLKPKNCVRISLADVFKHELGGWVEFWRKTLSHGRWVGFKWHLRCHMYSSNWNTHTH